MDLPDFVWLSDGKVGATWLVHRLLWYALQQQQNESQSKNDIYQPGIQERLMQRLFKAFHVESQDMSDINVLSKLACEMKLFESDQEKAKQWLESDQGEYEVGLALEIGMRNGIQSIPFTIVQDGSDHSSQVMNHVSVKSCEFDMFSDTDISPLAFFVRMILCVCSLCKFKFINPNPLHSKKVRRKIDSSVFLLFFPWPRAMNTL